MTITIRTAREHDMDWLIVQLRAFDKFAGYKRSLIEDEHYARKALKQLIADHVVFIADADPALTHATLAELGVCRCARNPIRLGFIAGYKTPHPFNPRLRVLTENFWWVAPEHRKTRAGLLLLNEFEAYGRRCCDWIVMTLEHHSPISDRHLTKRGFVAREQSYLVEV